MKTYPKGTKWRVWNASHKMYIDVSTAPHREPIDFVVRARAMRVLWGMRELCPTLDYRLRVVPPRVDHKAEVARLRAAIAWAVERLREPTSKPGGKIELVRDWLDGALSGSLHPSITPPAPARGDAGRVPECLNAWHGMISRSAVVCPQCKKDY